MAELLSEFFLSFGLLAILALVGGLISIRLKQPTVVGLLLIGLIIDPANLGFIHNKETISVFAEVGATLLLFSIGLEFSIPKILGSGMRALFVSSGRIFVSFLVGYEAGMLMGLGYVASLALGACFSFTATAIFIRVMESHNLMSSKPVPLLISALVIEDMAAVAALTFFASFAADTAGGAAPGLGSIVTSLLFSIAIMGFIYIVLQMVLGRAVKLFQLDYSKEFILLFSLGLCVSLSIIASQIGLSASIGAFLAGSIIAGMKIKEHVEEIVSPFSLAFTSFFFLSIGLLIPPAAIIASWPIALGLTALFLAISIFIMGLLVYLAGYELEDAVIAGTSMTVMSEFSLIIANYLAVSMPEALGGFQLVPITALIVVFSTLASSALVASRGTVLGIARPIMTGRRKEMIESVRNYIAAVIDEFEGKGQFLRKAQEAFKALITNLAIFALVATASVLIINALFGHKVSVAGYQIDSMTMGVAIAVVPLALVILNIIHEIKLIADSITSVFVRIHPGGERAGRRIARDFTFTVPLLLAMFALPIAVDALRLPEEFQLIKLFPIAGVALLCYDALTTFIGMREKKLG